MARKQKSKGFNKFLDLIGLVDTTETGADDDFDTDYDAGRARSRNSSRTFNSDDEFAEPRMSRSQPRRDRTAASGNASNSNRFDADEAWDNNGSSRPEYGARNQQRAQSSARPSSGRYGNAQTSRSSARYDGVQGYEDNTYYRSNSYPSSGNSSYQPGSYRSNSYAGYAASARRGESENAFTMDSMTDTRKQQGSDYQRHQTVIFKLRSVDECKGVILALIEKKSVLLNLDDLDSLQAQRTLDTMSGATFAIGARLSRASDRTWLITPSTVDVNESQTENSGYTGSGRYL